jgi:lipopolysaccharide/colanic/teichoic acid biosynthesis glycosyltransferase
VGAVPWVDKGGGGGLVSVERVADAIERVAAGCLVVALAPLLGIIAVAVRFTSPGPALYVADRLGRDGRAFRMLKFRSMRVGSAMVVNADSKTVVEAGDSRLTPIGSVLRKGFDELPQIINIARGEMAFIGPRPDAVWMRSRYTAPIKRRLAVKPGITGLAQVCDARAMPVAAGYALDAYYVAHRSIVFDMRIIHWTILYLLGETTVAHPVLERIRADPSYAPGLYEPMPDEAGGSAVMEGRT